MRSIWIENGILKRGGFTVGKNLFDLRGKVAFVTGASSGLGVQFALALARQGADVVIGARRIEKLSDVKAKVEAEGAKCLAVKLDVTDIAQVRAAVADAIEKFGKIDILVNNAGIGLTGPAASQPDEVWNAVINTNINGSYYVAREIGAHMIGRGYGRIINIGSIHSTVAMPGSPLSAYATSKGGIEMMTKALASEWAKSGVTVNAIGPAYFPSEMTDDAMGNPDFLEQIANACPMGRPGRDGELDGALVYFASDASSYTTGQLLTIDGGWTAV
jgi:NAD(P)-dependent dehydrogenase (short-subunit alcohol dehydrogenase family)